MSAFSTPPFGHHILQLLELVRLHWLQILAASAAEFERSRAPGTIANPLCRRKSGDRRPLHRTRGHPSPTRSSVELSGPPPVGRRLRQPAHGENVYPAEPGAPVSRHADRRFRHAAGRPRPEHRRGTVVTGLRHRECAPAPAAGPIRIGCRTSFSIEIRISHSSGTSAKRTPAGKTAIS